MENDAFRSTKKRGPGRPDQVILALEAPSLFGRIEVNVIRGMRAELDIEGGGFFFDLPGGVGSDFHSSDELDLQAIEAEITEMG
jgi:hypothetical protein